jgi:hypothetical protein
MINQAISNLRPTSSFSLMGDTHDTLIWQDANTQPPTLEEVNAEIARLEAEYTATQYKRDRAKEYPDFKDYLDGIVKGDNAQVQAYIDACLAVKAKYPKGSN